MLPNLPEEIADRFSNLDSISTALAIAGSQQTKMAEILGSGIPNLGIITKALEAASIQASSLKNFEMPALTAFTAALDMVNYQQFKMAFTFNMPNYFTEIAVAMAAANKFSAEMVSAMNFGNLDYLDKIFSALSTVRNDVRMAEIMGTGVPGCIDEFTKSMSGFDAIKEENSATQSIKRKKKLEPKANIVGEGENMEFNFAIEADGKKIRVHTKHSYKLTLKLCNDPLQKHLN